MGTETSDLELMERVRDGDLAELGVLFERHHRRLFNFFRKLGSGRPQSEDLVQEVFVRILKYRRNFRPGSDFLPWVYRIARNAAADYHQRGGREVQEAVGDSGEPHEHPDARPLASEELLRAEAERRLGAALDRLPAERREVLVLARYQELRYDQIAALLETTVPAVKVRVHRAMKQLRDLYRGAEENAEEARA